MKTKNKSAFTLIEMIVVLAIIGTLLGIVISQFSGATESAKAAQCEANLKNLATAAHTCAQAQQDGYFPPAGSFWYIEYSHKGKGGVSYPRRIGWISGSEPNNGGKIDQSPIPYYDDKDPKSQGSAFYAITNGARGEMWRELKSQNTYMCPIHAAAVHQKNGNYPGWSYVMNREFGMKDNSGSWFGQTLSSITIRDDSGKDHTRDHSKVLMFAELQGIDITKKDGDYSPIRANLRPGTDEADAILDYKKNESIGFNHKVDKRKVCGHVAFADCHVEKFNCPKSSSALNRLDLTKKLCRGHEIASDGNGKYTDKTNDDAGY